MIIIIIIIIIIITVIAYYKIIIIIYSLFFIIYVPSQQLHGQLQTQHSVDTGNYIMDKHNIKPKINYKKLLERRVVGFRPMPLYHGKQPPYPFKRPQSPSGRYGEEKILAPAGIRNPAVNP
jgi:hypothetical protein